MGFQGVGPQGAGPPQGKGPAAFGSGGLGGSPPHGSGLCGIPGRLHGAGRKGPDGTIMGFVVNVWAVGLFAILVSAGLLLFMLALLSGF